MFCSRSELEVLVAGPVNCYGQSFLYVWHNETECGYKKKMSRIKAACMKSPRT